MPAIKKHVPHLEETVSPQEKTPAAEVQLEEVSEAQELDGPDSPARLMQAHLEDSIKGEARPSPVMDVGRVLATASGITTLLGVFIFSGIW